MDIFFEDTIAAISTAQSPAGIGIVRMSGPDAFKIADRVYHGNNNKKLAEQKANTVHYGWIRENDRDLDEVLVVLLCAPHSYTGENTVEIDCHGGILSTRRVLSALLKNGARIAEPGEFTKRAFLNGRMDLSQAEAVMDVISAKSEYALDSSLSQLKGSLKTRIENIRGKVLNELAFIEAALDDPEHYSLDGYSETIIKILTEQKAAIASLIETAERGKYIEEGIRTVIVGKPNVGKSSLLNLLSGKERAIVTDIPGTTRDTIEETISFGQAALRIIDTAGIHASGDKVEQIGVKIAKDEASGADLVLFVADSSRELDDDDKNILELIKNKKAIVLLNKSDLPQKITADEISCLCDKKVISISASEGSGIEMLKDAVKDMFFEGEISFNDQVFITNMRHLAALKEAEESIGFAIEGAECGIPEDVYSSDLYAAINALDKMIGGNVSEDLVNEIFSKFCMGK